MREHALFSALMASVLMVSFLVISLVPLWAAKLGQKEDEQDNSTQ